MFFTDAGLQQASGEAIADYKATRFPAQTTVLDLCCGIGGDLLSLAVRGPALGFDRDEITALVAAANCATTGRETAAVRAADVATLSFDDAALLHIDPDRRPHGRRTTRLELHEPSGEFLHSLLQRRGGAMKLAPACEPPDDWRSSCELEWISHQGECKQLVVWFGELAAERGTRAATVLRSDAPSFTLRAADDRMSQQPHNHVAADLRSQQYIYEPDAAVIAAGLVCEIAERYQLLTVHPRVTYLAGDVHAASPALAAFEILEILPLDLKRIKAALRTRGIGRLEVKKRGVPVKPEEFRQRLRVDGDEAATLIITPHGSKTIALLARRL